MSLPRPTTQPPQPWAFPSHERHQLDNGMTVLIYPVPGQYVTATRLVIPAPLRSEPVDREGVATLVSRTMDEGTERRSGDEMAEALERNGIGLGASAMEAGLMLDIDATGPQLEAGLDLLTECLTMPTFAEGEVGRHRRQRLVEIEHTLARPGSRAALEWARTHYAPQDRASRASGGRSESVAAITRDDCANFHRAQVNPSRATVVIAGDVEASEVLGSVQRTLATWAPPSPGEMPVDDASPYALAPERGRIVFVDRPGSVQTEMYLGTAGPSRRDPQGGAVSRALSYLIGGSPNARIDALLREDKGYTYGMRSTFRPRAFGGEVLVSGSVRGDVTAEALDLVHGVLESVAAEGFSADETQSAIDYIGKTAPARFATADVIADEAAMLAADGLGTDFVTTYLADLAEVTPDQLQQAWSPIAAQPWSVVLVGDAEAYAGAVTALGRGEVTVVSG
ncbi:M16 family metallopeptidase [Demetria terragena]|uniref:M16 family metallopeptidase n=1 Tax=Demetria terragena TaxID=63959 RepID=UPI000360CF6E|nr:pitrilysin family protein [Demetria terragena]